MPTVRRIGPVRFFFYSNEGTEPPHVHVEQAGAVARFWLEPVSLASSSRLRGHELRRLEYLVVEHREHLHSASMRLEYLPDGSTECPLIRLFDFRPDEAARLGNVAAELAAGRADRVVVHELPGVVALGGCELVFRLRSWDQAVVRVGPARFECGFTALTWDNVAGLIKPFEHGGTGFQWLAESPGEARLLLSVSGGW